MVSLHRIRKVKEKALKVGWKVAWTGLEDCRLGNPDIDEQVIIQNDFLLIILQGFIKTWVNFQNFIHLEGSIWTNLRSSGLKNSLNLWLITLKQPEVLFICDVSHLSGVGGGLQLWNQNRLWGYNVLSIARWSWVGFIYLISQVVNCW